MEPILKKWYDGLKDGKLLGMKCTRCEAVEFPPVPACNNCGCLDMEWTEISGDAELVSVAYNTMGLEPYHKDPVMTGFGRAAEAKGGTFFGGVIVNAGPEQEEDLVRSLPLKARLTILKMDDEVCYPAYELVEEE